MRDKVLIIEDSPSFASMLKKLIEDTHHFVVDIAPTLARATELLTNHDTDYFVSIVDLHLPDAEQGEASLLVRSYDIPTLVFTGNQDHAIEEDLWAKGVADYAHKSGSYSLEYVVWMVGRLYRNAATKVLVVDDSAVARKTMTSLLAIQQFTVVNASNPEDALEALKHHPDIRVALLDCHLNDASGLQLATKIRETFSKDELAIIGVSTKGNQSISAAFIKSGADDFLVKPFVPEEFFCRVNHAVARIESVQQLKELNHVKNRLLATAAHDIRGPIGVITNAAKRMLKPDTTDERRGELIDMIKSTSEDLLTLLNDLLDMSVIESGKLEVELLDCNMDELVSERVDLYRCEAEKKSININTHMEPTIANADRSKLRQVVDNLLTNAIKYSPPASEVKVNVFHAAGDVCVEVIDSGPGINEDEQNNLFKPFSVLSSKTTGGEKSVGLGLAIAKNIVDAHTGTIGYRDTHDGRSCFYITLPHAP